MRGRPVFLVLWLCLGFRVHVCGQVKLRVAGERVDIANETVSLTFDRAGARCLSLP